jgi:hypothetical protein
MAFVSARAGASVQSSVDLRIYNEDHVSGIPSRRAMLISGFSKTSWMRERLVSLASLVAGLSRAGQKLRRRSRQK